MSPILTHKLLILSIITAKRQLIHNETAQRSTWNQSYDFVIVGAGTSGCVVANRLTEDPNVTVLLLEAGGAQDAIYTDIPGMANSITRYRPDLQWPYHVETNLPEFAPRRLFWPTGKVIGGSSTHNTMQFIRQEQRDFDGWAQNYGANHWSFADVLPYFRKFENNTDWRYVNSSPGYHGINGPVQLTTSRDLDPILLMNQRVFNEMGFMTQDLNGPNKTGTMISQQFIDLNGFRSSAGNAYIDPNPHPNNLHIVTRAQVNKILFNGNTAIGVEFDRFDTNNRVYARREIILSGGPYQTPQLLMLSGIGPRDNLQSFGIPVILDLPVGRNYVELPHVNIGTNISSNLTYPPPELTLFNLNQLYMNRSGALATSPRIMLYFSTPSNLDQDWPNIEVILQVRDGQLIYLLTLLRARSRGTATLQSSSPYIPLKFNSNIFSDPKDLDNAIEGLKLIFFVMERTSIAQYVTPPTFQSVGCPSCPGRYMSECYDGIRCYFLSQLTAYPIAGACRIGALNSDDSVVDPLLRVINVQNLRICDTSIVPNSNGPVSTALMIGERCSQFIKDCYNLK